MLQQCQVGVSVLTMLTLHLCRLVSGCPSYTLNSRMFSLCAAKAIIREFKQRLRLRQRQRHKTMGFMTKNNGAARAVSI